MAHKQARRKRASKRSRRTGRRTTGAWTATSGAATDDPVQGKVVAAGALGRFLAGRSRLGTSRWSLLVVAAFAFLVGLVIVLAIGS